MSSKSKRIYILGDDEIQHLYALPKLSLDEKDIFFTLNNAEMKVFEEMNAVATKIHFVLQYGYFKIKQRLFEYNYDSVKDDLEYINQRYALGAKLGQSILINARKRDNNKKILNLGGFSEFGIGNNQQVVQYAISLASRLINHATIFTELITYLNNQKIIVPPYTVMQDLITMVINIEERRLGNIINEHLPKQLEITLMEMLLSGKDLNLTSFKKIPKNFKYMAFRGELIKGENFKEAYYFAKKFLQKASISEYNIKYYARVAEKHNIAQLKKIKTTNAKLYLLCYIYYRYQQINDNLVICYNYYVDKFDDECKAHVMQKLIEHSKNYQNNLPKVSQLLRFMGEEEAINMGHDAFYNKANQILDKSEYKPTADYIDGVSFNEKRERWEYYGHISNRIKKYCRPVIRYLDLEYDKSSAPIEEVVTFLKGELSKKKISLTKALQSNLPTAFIKKGDGKYIRSKIDGKIVYDIDKYEIYAYLTLSKAINSGKVYCNESIKYKSLKSDLLSDEIWKDKGKILKDLGYANIEISASDKLDKLEKLVDEKIWQVNENINNGNNKYFKKDGDKWSVSYQAKGEDINHKFFQAIEKKSIVEVLHYVDAQTKFCESFNHIKTKYVKTKKEDDYIIACVIANGLGHGLYSMSQTSDISISTLMNYESNYLTVENLKKANDAVTNKIKELAIFKEWHIILDKLMGSVDGQKHESKYQTIQSMLNDNYPDRSASITID